jgi:hypothetical protein
MPAKALPIILYLTCLLFCCAHTTSEFYASGRVVEDASHIPVDSAFVSIMSNNKGNATATDKAGLFRIVLDIFPDSSDAAVLTIDKTGYRHYSKTLFAIWSPDQDTFYLVKQ